MKNVFPTLWQRVIFRNYSLVPTKNIANVLNVDERTVTNAAEEMGLGEFQFDKNWMQKGFVTIIRSNWDILENSQIAELLNLSEIEFAKLLQEYDFLSVKLGKKPNIDKATYIPLTEAEKLETSQIRHIVENNYIPAETKPFVFFKNITNNCKLSNSSIIKDRFTSCYCANYSGALLDDELSDYSDEYLGRLASTGINGIWIQETLRNIAKFDFDESLSPDYCIRIKNLIKLTERCSYHGINVYLYLNEPRSLPDIFFKKHPELKGQKCNDGGYCLCTSVKEVQDYLFNAIYTVFKSVPLLKGLFTITMSENPTHCYSKKWKDLPFRETDCPHCKNKLPEEVTAELNNLMCKAVKAANSDAIYIANLWSWADFMGWSDEQVLHGVDLLDKQVDVMCVSEFSKSFERGGVKSRVIDYSISVVGPSEITIKTLERAKRNGHRIWAKIQVNNSWECSAVPFIPVFDLMTEHIDNLKRLGVTGIMAGWSLGGYPGGVLPLCCEVCDRNDVDIDEWFVRTYGKQGKITHKIMRVFADAFKEFPFSIENLYLGYQNMGCGNFWSLEKDERISTMVCYTFDDYGAWSNPYGINVYISQYDKLCKKWEIGLKEISEINGNASFEEVKRCAEAVYIHYKSTLLFARFCKLKEHAKVNAEEILSLLTEEETLTKRLYKLISSDAKIGFEMTNHYYYTPQILTEKILNLNLIKKQLNSL